MPGLPLKDFLERFAEEHPETGIVICSAYVQSELLRRGIQAKKYLHIAKPFTTEHLLAGIRNAADPSVAAE